MYSFLARQRVVFSLLAALVYIACLLADPLAWWQTPLLPEIRDAVMIPSGLLLAGVLGFWWPHDSPSLMRTVLAVVLLLAGFEGLQGLLGYVTTPRDIALGAAGAAMGGLLLHVRHSGNKGLKRPLASTGVALLVVATLPVMQKLTAIEDLKAAWPMLANFEDDHPDALWKPLDQAAISVVEHGTLQTSLGMVDQKYLHIEAPADDAHPRSPGIASPIVLGDWTGMRTFCLEARSPDRGQLMVELADARGDDPVRLPYELTDYWKRHCTPLEALRTDSGRTPDLSHLTSIRVSLVSGTRLDVDNIRLFR